MGNTIIAITIQNRDPIVCLVTITYPKFDLPVQIGTWLTQQSLTFEIRSKLDSAKQTLVSIMRVEMPDPKYVDALSEFCKTLHPTYEVDVCYDKDVAAMCSPNGDMFAVATKWKKNGRKRKPKTKEVDVI